MQRKWVIEKVVHEFDVIDKENFRKLIEEVAEITYDDFCQLPFDSSICASNVEKPLTKAA